MSLGIKGVDYCGNSIEGMSDLDLLELLKTCDNNRICINFAENSDLSNKIYISNDNIVDIWVNPNYGTVIIEGDCNIIKNYGECPIIVLGSDNILIHDNGMTIKKATKGNRYKFNYVTNKWDSEKIKVKDYEHIDSIECMLDSNQIDCLWRNG